MLCYFDWDSLDEFCLPMFSNFDYNDVSKVDLIFQHVLNPATCQSFSLGTDTNSKSSLMEFGLVARNSIIISFIATVSNVVNGVVIGGIWGSQNPSTVS